MTLKYKIFITLITTSILILVLVISVMQMSIKKNFIQFVNHAEFEKLTRMTELLRLSYRENLGWDDFKENPARWYRLLYQSRPQDPRHGPGPGPHLFNTPQPHPMPPSPDQPMDPKSLHRRLCLFDADKKVVAGSYLKGDEFNFQPIAVSGRTVGWLGLKSRSEIIKPLELKFLETQTRAFYIIGLGILMLTLIISYLLSRHFLSPIQELAKGTRAMGEFNFDTRLRVNSKDELGALANDFNLMAQTLKQYETLRKNWISDISHELRTPVAVIRSKIEALQDGVREMTPQLLNSLHKDVLGLGKLINDLHLISLADSQNLGAKLRPVLILKILDQTLDTFLIRFEQQSIEIQKDWKMDEPVQVKGDALLLNRVFSNLLENTLKYTDSPGKLKLSCQVKDNWACLSIEDSFPAVPKDCLESIFDRLFRVEQSRSRTHGGSGLGLSITQEIILLHKGKISASNTDLGGLKIRIELPVYIKKI